MKLSAISRECSHVTTSLSTFLLDAIDDFEKHFNKKPKLMRVPYWRVSEIPLRDQEHIGTEKGSYVHGIRTLFSITCDAIELE